MWASLIGAILLGSVIGYLTHYLVRRDASPGIKDLAAIVGTVLGSGVVKLLLGEGQTNWYFIGLGLGFFLYWAALMAGRETVKGVAPERRLPLFPFIR